MTSQIQQVSQEEHASERLVYPVWWCRPPGRYGAYLWGGVLVLLGAVWLLYNLGWISDFWDEVLLPVIVIGLGLFYLSEAMRAQL